MHLAIWCNNNFKHFRCYYHDANDMSKLYAEFMKMLACYNIWGILSPWWKERVPRWWIRKWCHDNISVPVAHRDTDAKGSGSECVMQDDGVIPVAGFPRVDGMATRNSQRTTPTRGNTWFNSYTASIRSTGGHHGVIPSKHAFRAERVRSGSSHSWVFEGSSGSRSFSERYLTNPRFPRATVVELGESEFFGGRHRT